MTDTDSPSPLYRYDVTLRDTYSTLATVEADYMRYQVITETLRRSDAPIMVGFFLKDGDLDPLDDEPLAVHLIRADEILDIKRTRIVRDGTE